MSLVVLLTTEEFGPVALPGGTLEPGEACRILREAGKAWEAELVEHLAAARND